MALYHYNVPVELNTQSSLTTIYIVHIASDLVPTISNANSQAKSTPRIQKGQRALSSF